jgi:hypothetical protein
VVSIRVTHRKFLSVDKMLTLRYYMYTVVFGVAP